MGLRSIGNIPRFLLGHFKKGGMHLIGEMLIVKPQVGIALLSKGAAKAAFLLALNDVENVRAYLWFVQLGLVTFAQTDKVIARRFSISLLKLCVQVIQKWSKDPLNGRMIVWHSIRIFKDIAGILGEPIRACFDEIPVTQKENLIGIIEEQVEAEIQNKKMQSLIEFSTNDRGKRHSEWTVLEIGDSD
jgi:hypothetical protein